jgi:hypothetical protein
MTTVLCILRIPTAMDTIYLGFCSQIIQNFVRVQSSVNFKCEAEGRIINLDKNI